MRKKTGLWTYDGKNRHVWRFLLFPKYLGGEWRWLEFAEIYQNLWRSSDKKKTKWIDISWNPYQSDYAIPEILVNALRSHNEQLPCNCFRCSILRLLVKTSRIAQMLMRGNGFEL